MDFRHRFPNYPWSLEEINEIADEIERYAEIALANDRCPTLAGFARRVRLQRCNLYDWRASGKYPRLAQAMDYLKDCQEEALIDNALDKTWDSATARLMLSSHHGYTDRNTLQGEPGKPLQVEHDPRKAAAEIIAEHKRRKAALQDA